METCCKNLSLFILFIAGFCLIGCQSRPTNAIIDDFIPAYVISSSGNSFRLDTKIPVAPMDLGADDSIYIGTEYTPQENPPGEPAGYWTRQNTWYYPKKWTGNEEFWYGWMLLDAFSIDRSHHISPLLLEAYGVEWLFYTFRNDRFTAYYSPEVYGQLTNLLNGTGADSVFGIFYRAWPKDTLALAQVQSGSAAWNAGLRADDRILEFDGRWAAASLKYINDTAGHRPVAFRYLRPSTGVITSVTITRLPQEMPTVFVDTLPGGIGYICIGQFVSTAGIATDTLFQAAAVWLEANSTGAWILDLRDNGGGTITTAQNIVSALLPRNSDMLCIHERDFNPETLAGFTISDTLRTNDSIPQRLTNRTIYLLQNRGSASASEILISSLRENLGTYIQTLGDTSYGKGIGQIYVASPLNGFMAVTCMHLDPMRAPSYHGLGIAPDSYFADNDSAIANAWNLARSAVAKPELAKTSMLKPNLAVLEWNSREMRKTNIPILRPSGPGHLFPIR